MVWIDPPSPPYHRIFWGGESTQEKTFPPIFFWEWGGCGSEIGRNATVAVVVAIKCHCGQLTHVGIHGMAYGASLFWLFEQVRSLLIGPHLARDIMKNCGLGPAAAISETSHTRETGKSLGGDLWFVVAVIAKSTCYPLKSSVSIPGYPWQVLCRRFLGP